MMPSPRAATGFLILLLLLYSCAARPGMSVAGEHPFYNDIAFLRASHADRSTDADDKDFFRLCRELRGC